MSWDSSDFPIFSQVVRLNVLILAVVDLLHVYSCNSITNKNKLKKTPPTASKLFKLISIFIAGFSVMNAAYVFKEIEVVFDECVR